jgi:SagB-type dehydrogenase family enzyme
MSGVGLDAAELAVYERVAGAGPLPHPVTVRPAPPWSPGGPASGHPVVRLPGGQGDTIAALLQQRRSQRRLWRPLPVDQLAAVLQAALGHGPDGRRPYPTSGGCDELQFLLLAERVPGLAPGAWWVLPDGLQLVSQPLDDKATEQIVRQVCACTGVERHHAPSAVILLCCDWETLAGRYGNCTLVSGLWDCGAAVQALYLAATGAGLPACAVAVVQAGPLAAALGVDHASFGHVGTFALGGPFTEGS